ncbi:MAG: hypothetical protein OXN89_06795 [Bryobacterales bacterium]|nr:hypothetical protein [Bryobacterales bacterium]
MAGIPEQEAGKIWQAMREARIRSLYFGDMQARYTRREQWVLGLSLGLSSGAVIVFLQQSWPALAPALAGFVAIANAWAIATNLDQKLVTLSALRTAWESLRIDYSDLWTNWYEDGAQQRFEVLRRRANDLGTLASSGAPWDRKSVARWERFVDSEVAAEDGRVESG